MHVLAVADVDAGVGAGLALIAAGIIKEHQVAGSVSLPYPALTMIIFFIFNRMN